MLNKATEYAIRMTKCRDIVELKAIWEEIQPFRSELVDMYYWLSDIKDGNKIRLTPANLSEHLTKEGQEYIKNEGIL